MMHMNIFYFQNNNTSLMHILFEIANISICAEVEASLAEYLMEHLKSNDGKPLLKSMYSAKYLQFPKEMAALFLKRYILLKFSSYVVVLIIVHN